MPINQLHHLTSGQLLRQKDDIKPSSANQQGTFSCVRSTERLSTMSFTGKYELQSQENFEPFMKALGKCLHVLCAALSLQIPLIFGSQLCWCADDVDWGISEISCFCLSPCNYWDLKCICVEMWSQNRKESISLAGAGGQEMLAEVLWLGGSQSWQVLQPLASVTECYTHVISQQDLGGWGALQICSIRLWNLRASRTLLSHCAAMLPSLTSRCSSEELVLFKG